MRRLLPPVLVILLVAALAMTYFVHPNWEAVIDLPPLFALGVLLFGVVGVVRARIQFTKSDSEIMTFDPPRNLVTTGMFSFTRNPMYLSMLFVVLGAALMVNLWCGLLAPLLFFIAANWWYIPFEERAAAKAFGTPYSEYKQRVRRWL